MTAIIRKLVVEGGMYKIKYATHYNPFQYKLQRKTWQHKGGKRVTTAGGRERSAKQHKLSCKINNFAWYKVRPVFLLKLFFWTFVILRVPPLPDSLNLSLASLDFSLVKSKINSSEIYYMNVMKSKANQKSLFSQAVFIVSFWSGLRVGLLFHFRMFALPWGSSGCERIFKRLRILWDNAIRAKHF